MILNKLTYTPVIVVIICLFTFYFLKINRSYFKWIHQHWFYGQSLNYRLNLMFYFVGISLLLVSLLDLRGEEKLIKSKIVDQKTIILIDSSASMLVEDVKGNRFKRAIMIARHFVKNAAGHQISIVMFSDIQKRIVPFTDDINLLDSRLDGISKSRIVKGGSNIFQAIKESLQYFKLDNLSSPTGGNLLVLSDFEGQDSSFEIKIPSNISVAFVGTGTLKGGLIPIRSTEGIFLKYKDYKGRNIVSKLNERNLKEISKEIKIFKYWIPLSYSMPTEEIILFFKKFYKHKFNSGILRNRPVLANYILIPAVIFLIISFLLRMLPTFKKTNAMVFIFLLISSFSAAGEINSGEVDQLKKRHRTGSIKRSEIFFLAQKLIEKGKYEDAEILYSENVHVNEHLDESIKFNYATSLLKNNKIALGLQLFSELKQDLDEKQGFESPLYGEINKNILRIIRNKRFKLKSSGKNRKKKKGSSGKGEKNSKSDKGKGSNKSQKSSESKREEKRNKQKNKKAKSESQNIDDREQAIRRQRRMVKTPAIIKKLLGDDRNHQEEYLRTYYDKKQKNKTSRDW